MIYTLTISPSIDYYVGLPVIECGDVCRATDIRFRAGGKGINVSRMLNILGTPNKAICCVAGFTGDEIIRESYRMGLDAEFIKLSSGNSRINIKIKENIDSRETEINAPVDYLDEKAFSDILKALSNASEDDFLVLSGSICSSQSELYPQIMERTGLKCFLDCTGASLKLALAQKPYLVKPNLSELEEFCGESLRGKPLTDIALCAEKLRDCGAQRVLASLDARGAILITESSRLYVSVPQCNSINCTGSGDSMLAGYAASVIFGCSDADSLRRACACGSAKAFALDYPSLQEIDELMSKIDISEI